MTPTWQLVGQCIVAAIVFGAFAYLAWTIEIGVRERDRQRKAAMLEGMSAAGRDKNRFDVQA